MFNFLQKSWATRGLRFGGPLAVRGPEALAPLARSIIQPCFTVLLAWLWASLSLVCFIYKCNITLICLVFDFLDLSKRKVVVWLFYPRIVSQFIFHKLYYILTSFSPTLLLLHLFSSGSLLFPSICFRYYMSGGPAV